MSLNLCFGFHMLICARYHFTNACTGFDRIRARPSCLLPTELLRKEESEEVKINGADSSSKENAESLPDVACIDSPVESEQLSTDGSGFKVNSGEEFPLTADAEDATGDTNMSSPDASLPIVNDAELLNNDELPTSRKDVTSTGNHDEEPSFTSTALIDTSTTTEFEAKSVETSSSTSDGEASCGNKINNDLGSSRKLTEESTTVGNCKDEIDGKTCNVPAMDTTASAASDKENSASSASKDANIGARNGSSSSNDAQNDKKKVDGGSSAEKCKPLFRPGFLEKQPLKKCVKLDSKLSAEVTPKSHLNNHKKEVAKSHLLHENGGLLKNRKFHNTLENGDASTESDMCKSLENGGLATEI